ncbi:unnamed protein product [Phaedon cochleariae]|uniref:Uncharacterized protein n=1 Tax=Phaedon cochleariae TaxID=80249 RepID=A0A9N9SF77_PHACE|nr:unnamed protein product [Phaedon cochleariae]
MDRGNKFSCDCRLDWVYTLYLKTTQGHIRNSLEELQCTVYAEAVAVTTEVKEFPVCPNSERTVESLPCPPEYRPTPITVKQGTPVGTAVLANGSAARCGVGAVLAVLVLCFM